MPAATVIEVSGLRKSYGRTRAVEDVSFEVRAGEIFGLIGPNGAGKTTTLECVEGIRRPDAGSISVLGLDPGRQAPALQHRIGVQLQEAQLQKRILVREAVALWSSLYPGTTDGEALLERLGLGDKRGARFMTLSGGQKQRLFIALALIHEPELVFLDELTTGLDPQARRAIWDLVTGIRDQGKTVVLTTHLMEEAERLCDRVAIIEHGRVIELGEPAELIRRHCPQRGLRFTLEGADAEPVLRGLEGVESVRVEAAAVHVSGRGDDLVARVLLTLGERGWVARDVHTVSPTLEDVFLQLTGHGIRG